MHHVFNLAAESAMVVYKIYDENETKIPSFYENPSTGSAKAKANILNQKNKCFSSNIFSTTENLHLIFNFVFRNKFLAKRGALNLLGSLSAEYYRAFLAFT